MQACELDAGKLTEKCLSLLVFKTVLSLGSISIDSKRAIYYKFVISLSSVYIYKI